MNNIHDIAKVTGVAKIATAYLRSKGEEAPDEWTLQATLEHLGQKLAMQAMDHERLASGIAAFKEVLGSAEVGFNPDFQIAPEFHRVKTLLDGRTKQASTGFRARVAYEVRNFWESAKKLASAYTVDGDPAKGLYVLALQTWGDTVRMGEKTASTRADRETFAASFASAALVDAKIASMQLRDVDREKLYTLNAEAAFDSLCNVVKVSEDPAWKKLLTNPHFIGGAGGAIIGGTAGAIKDDENRWRGGAIGAGLGTVAGLAAGHAVAEGQREAAKARRQEAIDTANDVLGGLKKKQEATAAETASAIAHAREEAARLRSEAIDFGNTHRQKATDILSEAGTEKQRILDAADVERRRTQLEAEARLIAAQAQAGHIIDQAGVAGQRRGDELAHAIAGNPLLRQDRPFAFGVHGPDGSVSFQDMRPLNHGVTVEPPTASGIKPPKLTARPVPPPPTTQAPPAEPLFTRRGKNKGKQRG